MAGSYRSVTGPYTLQAVATLDDGTVSAVE